MSAKSDLELMEHADGEHADADFAARIERDPDARAKVEAVKQTYAPRPKPVRARVRLAPGVLNPRPAVAPVSKAPQPAARVRLLESAE